MKKNELLDLILGKVTKKKQKLVRDNTREMASILFESQEYWTADNTDPDFEKLPDNVFVANGEPGEEFIVIVMPLENK